MYLMTKTASGFFSRSTTELPPHVLEQVGLEPTTSSSVKMYTHPGIHQDGP